MARASEMSAHAAARDAGSPAMFELSSVGVSFEASGHRREVLSDVSFSVAQGEFVGVVGRSGTGKTTLLRVLGGLLPSSTGSVQLEGRSLTGPPDGVVVVFQDYGHALMPWRTVARNVALGLERRTSRRERAERVEEALELVGLGGRAGDHPRQLSGGMQQRLQIARALVLRPRVLLMDEPFGALDAMTKSALQDELLRVQERTGATIIFITHDIEEAAYLSDRVLVIAGSPGVITEEVVTGLPRPRDQMTTRELPRYLEVRHRLMRALHDEVPG